MARLLVKNMSYLVTCGPEDEVLENCCLLMEDGVITYIGPEAREAEEVIDAAGCIAYPGLVNTHHHLYQTFSRNLPQVRDLEEPGRRCDLPQLPGGDGGADEKRLHHLL